MKNLRMLALVAGALLVFLPVLQAQMPAAASNLNSAPALDQIAYVHGGAGPFAVAGYRMGERALKEMNLPRGTFTLDVVHKTPSEVQFSCIADGVQAATGVSVGKLNLKLEPATPQEVETVIRDRKSGKTFVFHLNPDFTKRYLNLPHEKLRAAGEEVLALPDDQIFSLKQ